MGALVLAQELCESSVAKSMLHSNNDMNGSPIAPRLQALQHALQAASVDLYLQPMGDAFQSEYVPESAARLRYVTGFTGSAGTGAFWAEPDADHLHLLFTDGRYTIQAAQELAGTSIHPRNSGEQRLSQWLATLQPRGDHHALRIGFDPWLITHDEFQQWHRATQQIAVEWVALCANPIDAIWEDRPAMPHASPWLHDIVFSGQAYTEKRAALLKTLEMHQADALVLTLADGVNWLLNLRGSDVECNPLLLGYFVLKRNGQGTLYSFDRAYDAAVVDYFRDNAIQLQDVTSLWNHASPLFAPHASVLIDPATSAEAFWRQAAQDGWRIIAQGDPTLLPKACKNPVELQGMRNAHRRDGVALARFLCWLDAQLDSRKLPDELAIVQQLEAFRAADARYRGPSFATIAGSGPHGAIVHYRATEASNRRLKYGELLLLDSGGQYDDGTTDVTRTIAIGETSPAMREHFTRVLKGHIALASAAFPVGTSGIQLDALARQPLWEVGLDYDHGTGHGVGAYLCVHEGPQRISKKSSGVPLQPGMILSNEPGYYQTGSHGIRIENLVAVAESDPGWLHFETLTLAPIDTRLIVVELLTSAERNWLNAYHRRVQETLEPLLDATARAWLARATRAI